MSRAKAIVKQSDLTRCMKAWKATWDTPPAVHVQPDGTVLLMPSDEPVSVDAPEPSALEKWRAGRANG